MPIGTRQIAGRLQVSQLGKGGTLVWNVTHKIDAPISNAKLTLKSPSERRRIQYRVRQ